MYKMAEKVKHYEELLTNSEDPRVMKEIILFLLRTEYEKYIGMAKLTEELNRPK